MAEKRTYTIPLRSEFRETERYNKTKRATKGVRKFLQKHMKSEEVKIGDALNKHLWSRGGQNPPHKVTVVVEKNAEGVVYADLEGVLLPTDIERAEEKKAADEKPAKTAAAPKEDAPVKQETVAPKKAAKKASKSTEE